MEHCTETENADGYIGNLTKFTRRGTPLSCWDGWAGREAGLTGERAEAGCSVILQPLSCSACTERDRQNQYGKSCLGI